MMNKLRLCVSIGTDFHEHICFLDRFGRRKAILLSGMIFTVGSIIMGAAPSKEVLLIGRIVVGIAVGK